MQKSIWALGLMSGTSLDGIDAALIRTDGVTIQEWGDTVYFPYPDTFRQRLKGVLGRVPPPTPGDTPEDILEIEHRLTLYHVDVVKQLLSKAPVPQVHMIGFHGQTLYHRSRHLHGTGETYQIGDASLLAQRTGIDVIAQFRQADVAAGGEGAPLVPIYHQALAKDWLKGLSKPVMMVNIGGISNVTWIGSEHPKDLIAFDAGPGNTLIDQWVFEHTGLSHDEGGRLAAQGCIHQAALEALLEQAHLQKPPPKSFDRLNFDWAPIKGLSLEDGAATLTALTAFSIAATRHHVPQPPRSWVMMGGGRHNKTLLHMLQTYIDKSAPALVTSAEDHGLDGDMVEAQAFAFLAVRSLYGLPLTYPGTTGVTQPTCGGTLHLAD